MNGPMKSQNVGKPIHRKSMVKIDAVDISVRSFGKSPGCMNRFKT